MYYIGIDISKFKHDCAVIDDVGDVVTPSWSFANDHEGFLQFKALLDSLGSETRIGLESTGHYGTNLKLFLESCSTTFMEFNPLLINRLGQFTRNYTQTVKRAADNKRRYAPGWVHSTCLLRGFPKGAAPHLAHDFA